MSDVFGILLCSLVGIIGQGLAVSLAASADSPDSWPEVVLPNPRDVELRGPLADALRRGVARLDMVPYTVEWIMADLSFEVDRRYTNFSGDVSGRFIELAMLTSPPGHPSPPTLAPVLAAIARDRNSQFQKADGHFGVDIDLAQELVEDSPPLCLLWGNARLLVGLIACAQECGDPEVLAAAKRLGDFYVATAAQLCSPEREAEYRASGTWGHSYTCDYFPAIEGLAMLYRATEDGRYLEQAQRMAEFFTKFDALPNDHSHGNLSAWRGILQLYEITGDSSYLERAKAKWDAAVAGGFVWPIGGIGEQWRVFYRAGETCSEADWLRFCLDLWRFTGDTRYLDIADRLLHNQYPVSQCDTGGYGDLYFDGDADAGPISAIGSLEADYCCCFAGPLALHFLKSYLAVGSERGVYVSLPFDFTSSVKAGGRDWRVAVTTSMDTWNGEACIYVSLAPEEGSLDAPTTLWLHVPDWAFGVKQVSMAGEDITPVIDDGYLRVDRTFRAGESLVVTLDTGLTLEGRRFQKIVPKAGETARFRDVSVLTGPRILSATMPKSTSGRLTILATIDASGQLGFPGRNPHEFDTVSLPSTDIDGTELDAAIQSAPAISLRPWSRIWPEHRDVLAFDVIVVPADTMAVENLAAEPPSKNLPMPGEVFSVRGHTAFLIMPKQHADPTPWVWYAPTLAAYPGPEEQWMFERFTEAGVAIAGIDVGESYGSPQGRALFTALYEELVHKRGMAGRPCLLARSRGGLMLNNWAVEHPECVAGIAGIYPVCDLRSYPGIGTACSAYEMTEQQLTDQLGAHNPVSRVEPLAKAQVPIFHIHGDSDTTVPIEANSAALAHEYERHGGSMKLVVIEGQGHNMWPGWFQCQELVDFVIARATGG
ncbi:MAG TPA: glycoside hydrolase family 127 protein [Candidatus Hydrogenedentes bacterium]|nr:glycoside hydrolase family 127 protein [Candidatus Hydrogenedentota bacterium]HPG67522.1 glycoside hydrolase family 127 protein [Candidatus Hydrogenedentota bacterium]